MNTLFTRALLTITLLLGNLAAHAQESPLAFEGLPPMPAALTGHFAGTVNGVLVVAGGTSFEGVTGAPPTQYWHNKIYRLADVSPRTWHYVATLAAPRANGASVTHTSGTYLIGGGNGRQFYDDVMLLAELGGELGVSVLPERMPAPVGYPGATLLDDVLYVCGGQSDLSSGVASNALWSLDLANPDAKWAVLEPLPGEGRISPAMAELGGSLYVVGGMGLSNGADGKEFRTLLSDAWRYTPGKGWSEAPPLPHPLAGAAASSVGNMHLLLYGGETGASTYSNEVLALTPTLKAWNVVGQLGEPIANAPATLWKDAVVIPGGDSSPGEQTANAYLARVSVPRTYLDTVDWAFIVLYLAAMLGIGFYFSGKEQGAKGFFLGDGNIPWWAVGLSIFGTAISSITYLSIPARVFATDWTMFFANIAILFVAPIVVWFYIPRFRSMNISTAYEYLEKRFGFALRAYGSLCFMLFQFGRISVVMFLPALALSETTGMNTTTSILLMGGLTTVYTMMGGITAVIWTDVVQSVVLVGGAVLALVLVILHVDGGVAEIWRAGMEQGKFELVNPTWSYAEGALWVILIGNIFANFYPATADQTIVQRYLTTKDEKSAARATWTNAALTLPVTVLFFALGTALWAYFRQHPMVLPGAMRNDAVLPVFMMAEFPSGARGLLISGVFAAAMSSLSSSMNSVASVVINDYYKRFIQPGVSELSALRLAQGITLVLGIAGTAASLYIVEIEAVSLWDPFLELLGLAGGGLAGIFALGIFVKRANYGGALTGAIASAAVLFVVRGYTDVNAMLFGMIGFLTALFVGWGASLLLPAPKATNLPV